MSTNLLENYLLVARCWNDHALAVSSQMTTGRAIWILRGVQRSRSALLRRRAVKLLDEIVYNQPAIPSVEQDTAAQ